MDGSRFDGLVRALTYGGHSRRGAVRLTLATGVAVLTGGVSSREALACRKNGRKCDPRRNDQCCSSKCKRKRDGKGVCKRVPSAAGCTIDDNTCSSIDLRECPGGSGVCVVLNSGRPFCARTFLCTECQDSADCAEQGVPNGRCVRSCPFCEGGMGGPSMCVSAQGPT